MFIVRQNWLLFKISSVRQRVVHLIFWSQKISITCRLIFFCPVVHKLRSYCTLIFSFCLFSTSWDCTLYKIAVCISSLLIAESDSSTTCWQQVPIPNDLLATGSDSKRPVDDLVATSLDSQRPGGHRFRFPATWWPQVQIPCDLVATSSDSKRPGGHKFRFQSTWLPQAQIPSDLVATSSDY